MEQLPEITELSSEHRIISCGYDHVVVLDIKDKKLYRLNINPKYKMQNYGIKDPATSVVVKRQSTSYCTVTFK